MPKQPEDCLNDLQRAYAELQASLTTAKFQEFLEFNAQVVLRAMGVAAGSEVSESGERSVIDILKRLNKPICIFDVGANRGQFATMALKILSSSSVQLHCFEPGDAAFANFRATFHTDARVHLNQVAMSNVEGQGVLHYDQAGSGLASLSKRRLDHFGIQFDRTQTIRCDTIDSYCARKNVTHIDLLKLDIEGHELSALHGASHMLRTNSIDFVTFEFGGANIDSRTFLQDFFYFFREYGMRLFRITPTGYLHPLHGYREMYEQFMTTNFLAASADTNL